MPDLVLQILKYGVVAILYLFLWRVLAAVWAEVRAPKLAEAIGDTRVVEVGGEGRRGKRRRNRKKEATGAAGRRVHVTEPPELRGTTFTLSDLTLVGRSGDNDIILDHPTVSSSHCRFVFDGPALLVEDIGSRNGTYVNHNRLNGPARLGIGDEVGVGPKVTLEVLP